MLKRNYLKFSLSTVLLALLLFLSCDNETPTSSPPPELSYELELFVDNDSCDPAVPVYSCTNGDECDPSGEACTDGSDCASTPCDESTAYAADNALGELEITARLQVDGDDEDSEMTAATIGVANVEISRAQSTLQKEQGRLEEFSSKVNQNFFCRETSSSVSFQFPFKRSSISIATSFISSELFSSSSTSFFLNSAEVRAIAVLDEKISDIVIFFLFFLFI